MRSIGIILLTILVLIVGAGGWFAFHAGAIVKDQIETIGSAATKTKVTVGSVNLGGVLAGMAEIDDLKVGNPEGYSPASAVSLGTISVKLDPMSLFGKGPIHIRLVSIAKPAIAYEGAAGLSSNLAAIEHNVNAYAAANGGSSGSGSSKAPARKLIIDDLYLKDGVISISHPALKGTALSAPLPLIHLTNVGGSSGATTAQVASQLLEAVLAGAVKAAIPALTAKIGGGPVGGAVDTVRGILGGH